MSGYWMEDAERVHEGNYIGECDNGDLWVRWYPFAGVVPGELWHRFSCWNLQHWLVYWRSRRAGRVVSLERAS